MAGKSEAIVISLGGSFLFANTAGVRRLKSLLRTSLKAIIMVGGGKLAREYIRFGKDLGLTGSVLHEIGIGSTRLNASIISKYFKCGYYSGDPRRIGRIRHTVAIGGYKPGWTTDVCAAYACVSTGSKTLFNISKEKGVFDKNPDRFEDASLMHEVRFKKLYMLTKGGRRPGMNYIFDPMAARICESNGIDIVVTNKVADISRYIDGLKISGSIIHG